LECVVYGKVTGATIAQFVQNRKLPAVDEQRYIQEAQEQIKALVDRPGQYRINQVRQKFQDTMTEYCGVFRSAELMQEGLHKLEELEKQYQEVYLDDKGKSWNTEIVEALELRSLIIVGKMILTSALNRQESRGAHSREDFTQRDDDKFLKHTLAYYSPAGIDLAYMPVAITMFEPQERKY
jgi:succinate dehydrogenase / fumarate reductase flavoprotein subunit